MIYGSPLGSVAGLFAAVAAVSVFWAIKASRVRLWRDMTIALAAALPCAVICAALLVYGSHHPPTNMRGNIGYPPDWSCFNPGRGAGTICGRDARAAD